MTVEGSFGRVRLAKSKKNGDYFAMKILKKADIIKLKQVDHVISENTILADIDHPFLVVTPRSPSRSGCADLRRTKDTSTLRSSTSAEESCSRISAPRDDSTPNTQSTSWACDCNRFAV